MRINTCWAKRRWLDFRNGHSTYLIFVMSFMQFVIISYSLYIEGRPTFSSVFPTIYHWITVFLLSYVPLAIFVGHLHLKRQYSTESVQYAESNELMFRAIPGKEQLYNLPAMKALFQYLMKDMSLHNQLAESMNIKLGTSIQKYDVKDFDMMQEIVRITQRLQDGDNIKEILK